MKPVAGIALLGALLIGCSVLYVDRPVTSFVFRDILSRKGWWLFFDAVASPSLLPMPCACLYLLFYTLRRLSGRPAGKWTQLLLTLSVATALASTAKDELKWLVGRPWPGTWIKFGAYQCKPFVDNVFYGSFPSGHTTYIAAPMFVLWWRLPRYRALWLAIIFMVMVGLVASGHHFVGDVIAGFLLGLGVAAGTVAMMRSGPWTGGPAIPRSRRSP